MSTVIAGWQSWSDTRRLKGTFPRRHFDPLETDKPDLGKKVVVDKRFKAPTGWCSWHCFGGEISESIILTQVRRAAEFGLEYILIDDGWTVWGDWLSVDKKKFPHGLKALVNKIRSFGLRVGIWWAPMLAKSSSELFKRHPGWFIDHLEGTQYSIFDIFIRDKRRGLDLSNPNVQKYLNSVLDYFLDCGFELLKSDFLYAGHFDKAHKTGKTPDLLLRDLLKSVYDRNFYSIACGCPLTPAIGVVDAMRISDDINIPQFNNIWPLNRIMTRQRVMQLSSNINSRLTSEEFWHLDPDAFISDPSLGISFPQAEVLASLIEKCRGVVFFGDNLALLRPYQLKLVERLISSRSM